MDSTFFFVSAKKKQQRYIITMVTVFSQKYSLKSTFLSEERVADKICNYVLVNMVKCSREYKKRHKSPEKYTQPTPAGKRIYVVLTLHQRQLLKLNQHHCNVDTTLHNRRRIDVVFILFNVATRFHPEFTVETTSCACCGICCFAFPEFHDLHIPAKNEEINCN